MPVAIGKYTIKIVAGVAVRNHVFHPSTQYCTSASRANLCTVEYHVSCSRGGSRLNIDTITAVIKKLTGYCLKQLVDWYYENLGDKELRDPRGHIVRFDCSRFAYLIKLVDKSGKKIRKPLEKFEEIRAGNLSESKGWRDLRRPQPCFDLQSPRDFSSGAATSPLRIPQGKQPDTSRPEAIR